MRVILEGEPKEISKFISEHGTQITFQPVISDPVINAEEFAEKLNERLHAAKVHEEVKFI